MSNVQRAIASFQRTLISGNSPYDRWQFHSESDAVSDSAKRGFLLFSSEKLECFHCHGGFNFTDHVSYAGQTFQTAPYHNTGLYDIDGLGGYPAPNTGMHEVTMAERDMGMFKAPTLRNIALTAPYMHDGSIATLERGARSLRQGRAREELPHRPAADRLHAQRSRARRHDRVLREPDRSGVRHQPQVRKSMAQRARPASGALDSRQYHLRLLKPSSRAAGSNTHDAIMVYMSASEPNGRCSKF